ncbi:MAG: galactokinase, partial [Acidobacteriota bacterium]
GGLIDLSQRNAERYLRNQTEETIHLQRSARNLGAIAASAFGAGFGGSVYALINSEAAPEFSNRWRASYIGRFPVAGGFSEFFTARISQLKSSEI